MASSSQTSVSILVNGKRIQLNDFVSTVTANLVTALVNSLKLDEKPETIEISIKQ